MRNITLWLWLSVVSLLLSGCGGGNGVTSAMTGGRGSAAFTVQWPERSRLIPDASNSIRVLVRQGETTLGNVLLQRPPAGQTTATANFETLPVGNLTLSATAYPQANGSGVAQASANAPLIIQSGQTTNATLTMLSLIDRIEMTNAPPLLPQGEQSVFSVTARNVADEIVLLSAAKGQWRSDNSAIASVSASGLVTALALGTTTIRYTDTESGKIATQEVTVRERAIVVNGQTYLISEPGETIIAPFAQPEGGTSTKLFSGLILARVKGVGQSNELVHNDAFYLYDRSFTTPQNGHDGGFYQLTFGTTPLTGGVSENASRSLIGSIPEYNPQHEYTIVLDTRTSTPSLIHFGVSDGGWSDNTGAFEVQVSQLVPAP